MILAHRKRLAKLMVLNDMAQRDLAQVAGYKSHTYMGKLLRGEKNTLTPEAALRIAHHFKVPVDDLFLTRVASNTGHDDQLQETG